MAALLDDDAGGRPPTSARCAPRVAAAARPPGGRVRGDAHATGCPVEVIAPQGAIYLSVRVALPGRTNEETRKLLLDRAGLALVPFQAFGLREDSGWFRISVGAVSLAEIDAALPRVRAALAAALSRDRRATPLRRAALVFALAVVLRVGLFPFAENKHGDAPMRALIAERMVLDPASAAVPRTYCQFGPLHTTLMRPFIALDPLRAALVALPVAALRASRSSSRSSPSRAGWWGEARADAGGVRAGGLAAAPAGVDHRLQRGALPPALGRARSSGCSPRSSRGRLRHLRRRRAARVAGGGHALRRLAGAADGRRRPPGGSRASPIRRRRRAAWRCSRCARVDLPGRLARLGGARPAAIRSSSRTTSPATTPGWRRRRRRATARCSGARASSASGRWRSSRR